jgi:hypothetical protein
MLKLSDLLHEKMTFKAKILVALLLMVIVVGGGVIAFKFYDFTQNNPKFCISCHLMQPAYDAWAASEHKNINCHDCHHLTIAEQNNLLVSFVLHRPTAVPDRHGKVIVPWKFCVECHWEENPKHPEAKKVNKSWGHAKHYFMEKIECAKCHGYITHKFTAEERFCVRCHKGKEVHGVGMENLACLNCHTDRTHDIKPDRAKCLYCHGPEKYRKEILAGGTIDARHHQPDKALVDSARKIELPDDAPMQFNCYECHAPHTKARPDWNGCLKCHKNVPITGAHKMHIESMGMNCNNCHKPHIWRVTPQQARKYCVKCHEYRDPKRFLMK